MNPSPRFFLVALAALPLLASAEDNPRWTVEPVASGFRFTEGPAISPEGDVYFTDIPNNRVHAWNEGAGARVVRADSGGANGLWFDDAGRLYLCEGKRRQVVRVEGGETTVLADAYDGQRLNSPNDLWVAPDGGLYFTDPRYGPRDDMELSGEHVYYLPPGGLIIRVADNFERPNGVIGNAAGDVLFVADHGAGQTWRYAINSDGTLGERTLFAEQGSDGMTIDAAGRVYLTDAGVDVYSPGGEHLECIDIPERPTNVTVAGESPRVLFVTARTSLYRVTERPDAD